LLDTTKGKRLDKDRLIEVCDDASLLVLTSSSQPALVRTVKVHWPCACSEEIADGRPFSAASFLSRGSAALPLARPKAASISKEAERQIRTGEGREDDLCLRIGQNAEQQLDGV
jgi:hypothetical protein